MIIRKGDKEITFNSSHDANYFLGVYKGFEHEAICESTGARLFAVQGPPCWDDGVIMSTAEWAEVARELVVGYNKEN